MKPSSSKITSDHFLLCLFLSLLWGVTYSNKTTTTPEAKLSSATEATTPLTTPLTTLPTTKSPPENVMNVEVVTQTESSITLMWDKVNNISTYFLQYDEKEDTISESHQDASIIHVVTGLTAGRKYDFTLITVFEGVNSSGYSFEAVTAPTNAEGFRSIEQNETSITLQWKKVGNILNYTLEFNEEELNITASGQELVRKSVSGLRSGTKHNFTLFTVFENVRSSGVNQSAVTAPTNAEGFKSVGQNETSITLQWKKVGNILNYTLEFNGNVINFTASEGSEDVTESIPGLRSGTKYDFTLFTVFENVRSSGVKHSAVTAPTNAEGFKSVGQNETSITLQWKKVGNILNYTLEFNGNVINFTASEGSEDVTESIPGLRSGTKYDFTLFTVFENVRSSGVNHSAVTAPTNAEGFKSVGQNETSITLQWKKVGNILNYTLEFNGNVINFTASEGSEDVTESIPGLRSGTKYDFTLFTVFENVRSSGVKHSAVTAPTNAEGFKSVGQNETSITLQWKKVGNILNYTLEFNGNVINFTASEGSEDVTESIPGLRSGTKYDFTLFTVFENVRSSGVKHSAVTVPHNAEGFKSIGQNETSITLQWKKVGNILNYSLKFSEREINITASAGSEQVTKSVPGLRSMNKYDFTLFTVFENVRSVGVNTTAFTAPPNAEGFRSIEQNETSITLQWKKVGNILNYTLEFNEEELNITASGQELVRKSVSGLRSGTKHNFTLFTVFENVRSSGVNQSAVTAPTNAEGFKSVGQNETSITLQWKKVGNILNYTLEFNGNVINFTASEGSEDVTESIPGLRSGTKYDFTLFTVFENVRSSGEKHSAVTAPKNVKDVAVSTQDESSITLMWAKVNNISAYFLQYDEKEDTISESHQDASVTYVVTGLTAGRKYDFTLITVFEGVNSSGYSFQAVTAPGNVNNVTVLTQSESSITLMWDKVNNISTYFLQYDNGSSIEVKGDTFYEKASVTYEVSSLNAGTKYNFTLITRFEKVNSTGFSFNAVTVPSMVALVNVTERSVSSITLTWQKENKDWDYFVQINGITSQLLTNRASDVVSYSVTSLQPGTEYRFNVITWFSGLNSTAYEGFTVTTIDCSSVTWHVNTTSIQGRVEGLFSNATATYKSQSHVSRGGRHVSFTGLYPGATYKVSLEYERNSTRFHQCSHEVTIIPPTLKAHCEFWAAGYSVLIVWNKPDGVWTSVEVNVTGKTYTVPENGERRLEISGFLPAKTYEVSLASLSGTVRSYEPVVFLCPTDPRGVIAGSVFAVLLFCVLVCLAVFIFLKRPDIISRKKSFIGGSKQAKKKCKAISVAKFPDHFHQLGVDENRGFSQEYESLSPVGTEQTRKVAVVPENKARNRFNNVLPYDWCRVKLTTSNPNTTSDYINASYMPGYNSSREYIATQGPLPSTVDDFWRMIWEQRVKGIVMVTNCTEGGKTKCERYWPAGSKPCLYGELLVTIRHEQQEPYWTLREFSVKHRNNSGERTVKHFHFTAWPDHGVPQGTEALIQFRGLVRRHIESDGAGAPTVVHCSAGVGRTGTIIALDVLLQQLQKERAVGINDFVHKMRLSRPHMVQTESQYVFLHQSIMDCLQPNETTEENIYENADMIYANATALQELR